MQADCPKCESEFSMEYENNTYYCKVCVCSECGTRFEVDSDAYNGENWTDLSVPGKEIEMSKSRGFYVINNRGGQSVAWTLTKEEALKISVRLNYRGGASYSVEEVK